MIGADTNLIVRFLTKDIEEKAEAVNKILDNGEVLYLNAVVLSELSWVLTKIYDYSKMDLIHVLDLLIQTSGFLFFDKEVVNMAIVDYINSSADFDDCLINQLNNKVGIRTLTFDKKAAKLDGMELLES